MAHRSARPTRRPFPIISPRITAMKAVEPSKAKGGESPIETNLLNRTTVARSKSVHLIHPVASSHLFILGIAKQLLQQFGEPRSRTCRQFREFAAHALAFDGTPNHNLATNRPAGNVELHLQRFTSGCWAGG